MGINQAFVRARVVDAVSINSFSFDLGRGELLDGFKRHGIYKASNSPLHGNRLGSLNEGNIGTIGSIANRPANSPFDAQDNRQGSKFPVGPTALTFVLRVGSGDPRMAADSSRRLVDCIKASTITAVNQECHQSGVEQDVWC